MLSASSMICVAGADYRDIPISCRRDAVAFGGIFGTIGSGADKMRPGLKSLLLLGALCSLPSCMTLTSGREQSVTISSVPGGARATIQPGNRILTTPAQIMLSRRSGYSVLIEKEGFEATSAAMERQLERGVWFNLLFVYGAPIGFAVDFMTGSAYRLAPSILDVSLRRVGEEAPPPTRIQADVTVHEGAPH